MRKMLKNLSELFVGDKTAEDSYAESMNTTIIIGGDPTYGHQISSINVILTKIQWGKLLRGYPSLENLIFDEVSVHKVPNLKCSYCGSQLPHKERLEDLLTYSHIYSSIQLCGVHEGLYQRFIFLLCGSSKHPGCIHGIMDFLEIPYGY